MFSIRSVKSKLILAVTSLFIILILFISAVSCAIYYQTLIENSETELQETAANYADEVNNWVSSKEVLLHTLKENIELNGYLGPYYLSHYLKSMYERSDNTILNYYISLSDNTFISSSFSIPLSHYDCSSEDWYQQAVLNHKLICTSPYWDKKSKKMIVTIAEPYYLSNRLAGVIAADISLYYPIQSVNRIKIGPNSYAFLLDASKNIITHIKPEFLPSENKISNLAEVMNGRFKPLSNQLNHQDVLLIEANDFDELNKYFVIANISESNWFLCLAVSQRGIIKKALPVVGTFIVIDLAAILFVLLAISLITHFIFKPFERIRKFITKSASHLAAADNSWEHSAKVSNPCKKESDDVMHVLITIRDTFNEVLEAVRSSRKL